MMNFFELYNMLDFIKNTIDDHAVIKNSLSNENFFAKKLILDLEYTPMFSPQQHKNVSLDYIRRFQFSVEQDNVINIVFSFTYDKYLIYTTPYLDMKEWETLENFVNRKIQLSEKEVRNISLGIYKGLSFYGNKHLYHLNLHPRYILIRVDSNKEVPEIKDVKVIINLMKITNFHIKGTQKIIKQDVNNLNKENSFSQFIPPEVNHLLHKNNH